MADSYMDPGEGSPLGDQKCSICGGFGKKNSIICPDCRGTGYDRENDERVAKSFVRKPPK